LTVAENPRTESLFAEEKAYSSSIPLRNLVLIGQETVAANPELNNEASATKDKEEIKRLARPQSIGSIFEYRNKVLLRYKFMTGCLW
jgi:hypothetical protein